MSKLICVPLAELTLNKEAFVDGPFGSNLKASEYVDEGVPVLRLQNIRPNRYEPENLKFITEEKAKSLLRHNYKPGDVVITKLGEPCGIGCQIPENAQSGIIVADVVRFRGNPNLIDHRYLVHFLGSQYAQRQVSQLAKGTTRQRINLSDIKTIEIPLVPVEEQRRLAAILDKADAVRKKRQQAIQLTEELLRAAFLEMFGDPVSNSKTWEIVELGTVTESKLGKMLSEAARKNINPVKYLGNSHVQWRSFNLEELPEMDFSDDELKKLDLRYGDLLVCEGGEVGRCAIWRNQMLKISFQKALHRVRCLTTRVLPEYLQEYFVFMAERGGLVSSTSTATIAHLTGVRLKQLPLPLPPIDLQKSFQQIYKNYEDLNFKYQRASNQQGNLFNSLMHRAFRGEL